ncbi:MAG: sulfur carrier protein ThiS adenylyltransferase ThiF [Candidatus Aminicenantales bacterium]
MSLFAVVGRSGTGKTTFLCRVIAELKRRGRTAAVVKHCGAGFDLGGGKKDSSLFFKAGAESVTLTGREGTAVLRAPRRRPEDRDLAAEHGGADYVFIEGGQSGPGILAIEVVGANSENRVSLRKKDRWIVVSARPIRTRKPVFSPAAVGPIVDLMERATPKTDSEAFPAAFFRRHDPAVRKVLRTAAVGIAGAGGLGSNVALALARAGVGKLILADFDRIEISNLNRQQYFVDQVSRFKVEALAENLGKIPSGTKIIVRRARVRPENIIRVFGEADILVEAFDKADQKQMLIESWLSRFPDRPIVAASGLAGYGANNRIRERRIGRLTIIGDEAGEASPEISPMAPRVAIVAAMQANRVVEILMKTRRKSC